ncbi:spore cortex-lytic enzyme [Vulcanibacillus modesticaldus]|uniref:Spore cortex-lytic enzyme n=1 Tax=Vulcanibacillus modesticaldus TaxID=337097 RepID=A0A1D2YXV9_9BACI|nr:spore cortex-lytic enzyme [Vulcanibacillus modesticaldus]OEG00467.1 spore cortex-lytic enzyme [Vulcanibacillus modesticaldus]
MNKYRLILLLSFTLLLSVVYLSISNYLVPDQTTFGKEILVVGKRGGDVYELQGRLKYLGYYKGKIDGIFGWKTYWAVRNFQYRFGMKVDGIVGPKTKYKLWLATKNWRAKSKTTTKKTYSTKQFSDNDIKLMANAVYGEARGEPYIGQVAVAAVILNRVKNPAFPNTPSGVIFEPGAFTAVADGQIWLTPNETAKRAVRDAIAGWDPSGGAIYYFNPDTATSAWIWSRPQIKKIGKHIFSK